MNSQNCIDRIVKTCHFINCSPFPFSFSFPATCTCDMIFSDAVLTTAEKRKLVVAMYKYVANEDSPGGFSELSLQKG